MRAASVAKAGPEVTNVPLPMPENMRIESCHSLHQSITHGGKWLEGFIGGMTLHFVVVKGEEGSKWQSEASSRAEMD